MIETTNKIFQFPVGHENHKVSSTIYECYSFGYGELDDFGFWEHPCYECARAFAKQFPELFPNGDDCWPHTKEYLEKHSQKKS